MIELNEEENSRTQEGRSAHMQILRALPLSFEESERVHEAVLQQEHIQLPKTHEIDRCILPTGLPDL